MKVKLARRYLNRNAWKLKKRELEMKYLNSLFKFRPEPRSFLKRCLKTLRQDMRETQNIASIRCYNNYMYR